MYLIRGKNVIRHLSTKVIFPPTNAYYRLTVKKINGRLDFVDFVLAQPSSTVATAGQCLTDSFTISGSSNTVPTICGINNNQHSRESWNLLHSRLIASTLF